MAQYLDESGLKVLWSKIKNTFTTKTEFSTLDTTFAEVVEELPTSGIKKHLYLMKTEPDSEAQVYQDSYSEYYYRGDVTATYDSSKWEKLGEYKAEVDLTPYAKTTEAVGLGNSEVSTTPAGVTITLLDVKGDGADDINIPNATTGAPGVMSAADKSKLDGLKDFRYVKVGTTSIEAESSAGSLTLAGSNVTLTPDTTNRKVTIQMTKANVIAALGYTPPTSNDNWVHAVCRTASATAAKAATHTLYKLQAGNVFILTLELANTCQGQITLDVNSTGAKTVYLNGVATSSTNYSIPAGTYLVYYDGTNYHIRTDKVQPVTVLKANTATSATSATMATKLGSATIGGTTTPIYLNGGTPTALGYTIAKSVPSNAVFTDTHYASSTAVGASGTTDSAVTTNGNTYIKHIENGVIKSSHKIWGAGATKVESDSAGNICITSTNTTYSAATTSANGLMSAADKTKLNGIATGATADSAIPTATIEALS